jgi:TfoX/Sxy family transcriptional regulator of competence genes
MSEFLKPDPVMIERVEGTLSSRPVASRKMFGTTAWFLDANSQMFASVWGDGICVRVGAEAAASLVEAGEASRFDPMGGRPMREYVLIEADEVAEDDQLAAWLDRAAGFASTLAPRKR